MTLCGLAGSTSWLMELETADKQGQSTTRVLYFVLVSLLFLVRFGFHRHMGQNKNQDGECETQRRGRLPTSGTEAAADNSEQKSDSPRLFPLGIFPRGAVVSWFVCYNNII